MKLTLAQAITACSDAREDCVREIKASVPYDERRWMRSREPRLLALDVDGERLNDSDWVVWRRRMREVNELIALPGCHQVIVDSGIDFGATKDELENGEYGMFYWQATLYTKDA